MRQINPKVELASGEFDRRRSNGIQHPGIDLIAKRFGISPRALLNYRANYHSRKKRQ